MTRRFNKQQFTEDVKYFLEFLRDLLILAGIIVITTLLGLISARYLPADFVRGIIISISLVIGLIEVLTLALILGGLDYLYDRWFMEVGE